MNEPLPREIIWILNQALNGDEATHLLAMYRHYGVEAAVRKGLWLNKRRSPQGRENWREYHRRCRLQSYAVHARRTAEANGYSGATA